MRRLSVVLVAHQDGNRDILRACVVVVFKYCYLKWCENCDLKSVVKIYVKSIHNAKKKKKVFGTVFLITYF